MVKHPLCFLKPRVRKSILDSDCATLDCIRTLYFDLDMKRVVKYTAIDPYYSDFTETYIGSTIKSIEEQQYELEEYVGREHPHGIDAIYKQEIILER